MGDDKKAGPAAQQSPPKSPTATKQEKTEAKGTPPRFDADEAKRFVTEVYGDDPGWVGLSWVGQGQMRNEAFPLVEDAVARAAELDPHASGIYLRTTTMRAEPTKGRGLAEDSLRLPGLWADLDFGTAGHRHDPAKHDGLVLPPDADEALRIIEAAALPRPTLVVHSGGGLYPWWLLDEPADLTGTVDEWAERSAAWQRQLQAGAATLGYHYGSGVGDLARVLRLPGSVNRKTAEERSCRLLGTGGPRYTSEALSGHLEAADVVVERRPGATRSKAALSAEDRAGLDFRRATEPGAFDLLDEHVGILGVLLAAGWTECGCGRPEAEACFTRPGGASTTPHSAHIPTAEPHVLVVFSEEAGLPAGGGQRLTAGRIFAHLHHGGDTSAAAQDLLAAMRGGGSPEARALGLPVQGGERDPGTPSTWSGLDLTGYLDGTYRAPEPTLLRRDDGVALLYPGLTHSIHGESESGKSMVVQHECVVRLAAGEAVAYIDFESDPASIVERLVLLGADLRAVAERFVYVQPDTDPHRSPGEREAFVATLDRHRYSLVVIDGVSESMDVLGSDVSEPNAAATEWARKLPRFIAERTGAAVVQIDHVVKNAEARGRFAIGGQAKMSALTGAAYALDVRSPIGRGLRGELVLRVAKDRPGYVRGKSGAAGADRTQEAARVVVDSTGERLEFFVLAPTPAASPDDKLEVVKHRIAEVLGELPEDHEGLTTNALKTEAHSNNVLFPRALDALVAGQYVTRTQAGQRKYHRLARPYAPEFES